MSVSRRVEGVCYIRQWPEGSGMLTYWCPGCEAGHTIEFGGDQTWDWDGDAQRPTISPSVLVQAHRRSFDPANPEAAGPVRDQPGCHSFVREGRIEYLPDCGHALAGTTVDMVELPARYLEFLKA